MDKIFEAKEYLLKFYAKYSRYVDMGFRFIMALLTFLFISNYVGFLEVLANPAVTIGLSLICALLPMTMPRPGYALPASSFLISRISMYPFPFYVKG